MSVADDPAGPAAHPLSSSHGHFQFAQTAAVAMLEILKVSSTLKMA